MRKNYVVGFAFSADRGKVVLIKKNRPAWQVGKLNGVGGKLELDEAPAACICREFFEETGVQTTPEDWHYYTKMTDMSHEIDKNGIVYFFRMFDDKSLQATTQTDEEVVILDTQLDLIREHGLSNLPWLIGIALDVQQPFFFVEANYNQDFATGKTGTN